MQWLELLSQSFPLSSPHFTPDHIPDLSGKVALVTKGNTGIGKETVRALLVHNATVYLAARSLDKAHAAIADLKADTGKQAIYLKLDLANLASVRAAASQFLAGETQLHVLFNNAPFDPHSGVMWPSHSELTKDGFDLQFGTNVVGHYLLTKLLLLALLPAAHSSRDGKSRVDNTCSVAAYLDVLH
ncbi:NAD(P)-binding protein [Dentipellis sp. KUC8613]|nr:NAD(P)-binding protein [Dentipellis sp. KUC8613]